MVTCHNNNNTKKCYRRFVHLLDKTHTNKNTSINTKNETETQETETRETETRETETQEDKLKKMKHIMKDITESYDSHFEKYKIVPKKYYDPNVYCSKNAIHKLKIPPLSISISISQKPKINVNIEHDINSIEDLLYIINTYPNDPNSEYNINMEMLHKIKEPLEKLNGMIGMKQVKENIVDQLLFYIQDLHNFKNQDFMHTVIAGPPGTGKTEVAKIVGSIFANFGILKKGTFKKVTRSDLVAGYLGQTAIKTKEVIKDSLGGVLFIDEVYSLGSPDKRDSFSKECIDTLCEAASDYKSNLMIIIAGYETELNDCFFAYNQGLNSRFIWRVHIDNYSGEDLYHIFLKKVFEEEWKLDPSVTKEWFENKKEYFKYYGRDIEALFIKTKIAHSRRIFGKSISERKNLTTKDLEKGFSLFLNNDEVKKRKEKEVFKNVLQSMYI